ncbi:ATP-binding cassette domain-containing protein [Catenuloplanes japonicus]|uniref:ATP-binding cassette domain-containing protein n=1 Tax=Catenuloplanes japonicus TaxID=33876 RepID=UPI0005249F3A|nr:ATP-binding cassette domain-containing protein [Catenuloplanes japonicus]
MTDLLHLDQVSRRYGGLNALHPIDLHIPQGRRHGIIGPNGAGKSTLLHLIAGTIRPSSGRILLHGTDITSHTPDRRARRGIGRTWQHPAVFPRLTVADNIALALPSRSCFTAPFGTDPAPAQTESVLARFGLADLAGLRAGALSYGQQRLLELALATAGRPRLLLLDEPSAGLGPDDIRQLADTLGQLPTDVTIICVDHDLDLIWQLCDTVTVLDHGRHLTTGTPAQVRAHNGARAAYLQPTTTPADRSPEADRPESAPGSRTGGVSVAGLTAGYHGHPVVHDLDLDIPAGGIHALLGRNGAGKSTTLAALAGHLPPAAGTAVTIGGKPVPLGRPACAAAAGIGYVPQGRRLFGPLTVAEHLTAATAARQTTHGHPWRTDEVLDLFPTLHDRLATPAGRLSGGEQQMLALARALLAHPRLLLLDEPTEGLAPAIVAQLAGTIHRLAGAGVSVLLAEHRIPFAVQAADQCSVLAHGTIAMTATPAELATAGQRQQLGHLLGIHHTLGSLA